jgi:hypothetical protein
MIKYLWIWENQLTVDCLIGPKFGVPARKVYPPSIGIHTDTFPRAVVLKGPPPFVAAYPVILPSVLLARQGTPHRDTPSKNRTPTNIWPDVQEPSVKGS